MLYQGSNKLYPKNIIDSGVKSNIQGEIKYGVQLPKIAHNKIEVAIS